MVGWVHVLRAWISFNINSSFVSLYKQEEREGEGRRGKEREREREREGRGEEEREEEKIPQKAKVVFSSRRGSNIFIESGDIEVK